MEITSAPVNVFVLGDLVLDHFIPVAEKHLFQPVGAERGYDGSRRRTITGGAANCARLIAALGRGRTCLWGISGHSPWGSFVQILQRSQAVDGSEREVLYHGSHNESHQMNTITRVVRTDAEGQRHREVRIDDVPLIAVTEAQARDALAYLQAEFEEHGVHAIILNDLDMKGLSQRLIQEIGDFARNRGVPLFVDPKREWGKYRTIEVTCAIPNLNEWCHIVGEAEAEPRWRNDLDNGRALERMAVHCLRCMPNAHFHIVKCDRLGAVLIGPSGPGRRLIYHIEPHTRMARGLPGQLGAGDVMVAALALEYSGLGGDLSPAERMLHAMRQANAVVACYLEMDWQKVPNTREIRQFLDRDLQIRRRSEVMDSVLLLPDAPQDEVDLGRLAIRGSRLVSSDGAYLGKVEELVGYLMEGWDAGAPRSGILTGQGGVGKSEIQKILARALGEIGVYVRKDFPCSPKVCPDVSTAVERIAVELEALPGQPAGALFILDEAFTNGAHLTFGANGKLLLQALSGLRVKTRLLFIDADYAQYGDQLSQSQFLSRCDLVELPSLASRRGDIAYVFAAKCVSYLKDAMGANTAKISEAVLLAVINWVLKSPEAERSPRSIAAKAEEVGKEALKKLGPGKSIVEISRRHLPAELGAALGTTGDKKRLIRFSWDGLE